MVTSVRLPDPLKTEAGGYASELGISLNALVAVALREYLDNRLRTPGPVPAASGPTPPAALQGLAPGGVVGLPRVVRPTRIKKKKR